MGDQENLRPRQVPSPQGWAASKACPPDAILICFLNAKLVFCGF